MRFDLVTIFPEYFEGPLDHGIVRRAIAQKIIEVVIHDLRSFTFDKHHVVDDRPFGGGDGMVLKPDPIFRAVESLCEKPDTGRTAVILLSASGKPFDQEKAHELSQNYERLVLICGRYEGVDERVAEQVATEQLSIGDYVLTGGEIPALIVIDAVTRLLPGALGSETSAVFESFAEGLLDCPQYTRPAEFRGLKVPDVLLGGNHGEVARWRRRAALEKTLKMRPDLLAKAALTQDEKRWLDEAGGSSVLDRGNDDESG